jgi:hypothetical protein
MNPLLVQEAAAALLSSAGRSGLKNLLSMIAAGVLIFAGLGYYLDWYKIQATAGPNGTESITLNVNKNEIKKDFAIVRDRAGQIINGKPSAYTAPTQPSYPPAYPQQNPYQQTQYPTQPYQQPYQQPTQYAPGYSQQPQSGYYPPAGTYPPPQQGNWTPTQPASRPTYQQPAPRPF